MSWSRLVRTPEEAAAVLAEPGDALDLRTYAELTEDWHRLGFSALGSGAAELVRPVPLLLDGISAPGSPPPELVRPLPLLLNGVEATASLLTELVRPVPLLLDGVEATRSLGRRLAATLVPGDLVVLSGPLGAGKTALTQGIGAGLGVQGQVVSPTFVLARVHRGPVPLVHVDAYRLRDAGATGLDDLDLDADLPASVVVVEWGDGLVEGLSDARLDVRLDRPAGAPDDLRTALVRPVGQRWAYRPR